jgi:hypothetical protein
MTSSSGVVFSFNYWLRGTVDAQKHCNQQGGHLASYSSMLEQNEVEQAFIAGVSRCTAATVPQSTVRPAGALLCGMLLAARLLSAAGPRTCRAT